MRVSFHGVRGSIPTPGPQTARYGGNTCCVCVQGRAGSVLLLDAGTGIRRMTGPCGLGGRRVDLLLTHLHADHIQGLGFFDPLYEPGAEVHLWGPGGPSIDLRGQLARYLSPPLFPLHLRELPCRLAIHDVARGEFEIAEFRVTAQPVLHPGPTVGYRVEDGESSVAYLPDHEPALGMRALELPVEWISGAAVALGADLLIHDSYYTPDEYATRVGWGHSSLDDALRFAGRMACRRMAAFHYNPNHDDGMLERMLDESQSRVGGAVEPLLSVEGETLELGAGVDGRGPDRAAAERVGAASFGSGPEAQ
ncbi:MAG: MBL fold metallo-hydrolase [Chthonomonadales bacterium]|nr:MBL fold metallo-hydrolase [Chthonomonadales bacterium]